MLSDLKFTNVFKADPVPVITVPEIDDPAPINYIVFASGIETQPVQQSDPAAMLIVSPLGAPFMQA